MQQMWARIRGGSRPSALAAAGVLITAGVVLASAAAATTTASDPAATAVASATLTAMGGQKAWNDTRYVAWNFFGRRMHVWDKWTGDVRIDAKTREGDQLLVLMNINTKQGRAWKKGQEVTAADDLAKLLEAGYGMWVNDSYWIFMPYKMTDPGVTLHSKGDMAMADGRMADCLELTFQNVGLTPENRYLVYVAKDTKLVEQWEYFEKASDDKPGFQIPWHGWARYGHIMLSGDRGDDRKLTDIAVFDALPREVFTSPAAVDLQKLAAAAAPR